MVTERRAGPRGGPAGDLRQSARRLRRPASASGPAMTPAMLSISRRMQELQEWADEGVFRPCCKSTAGRFDDCPRWPKRAQSRNDPLIEH
jgi:hypothetical protein